MKPKKPLLYLASPYTIGDVGMNVHYHLKVFDRILADKRVTPVAPLWAHFQHTAFPQPCSTWIRHSLEIASRCDMCLRFSVSGPNDYIQNISKGADLEVEQFLFEGKPVFYSIQELFSYLDKGASHA